MNPLSVIVGLVRFLIMATRLVIFAVCLLPGFIRVALWYLRSANVKRNIKYGPRPRNYLDLYAPPPSPDTKHPVLVFISGGAWMSTSPRLLRPPPTRAPFPAPPPFRAGRLDASAARATAGPSLRPHVHTPPSLQCPTPVTGIRVGVPIHPIHVWLTANLQCETCSLTLFAFAPSTLSSRQQGVGRSPWQGAQGTRRDVRDARLPEL